MLDVTVENGSTRTIKVNAPGESFFLGRGETRRFEAEEEEDFTIGTLRGGTAFYRYESAEVLTVEVTD